MFERALRGQRHSADVTAESEAGTGDEALRRMGFREEHRLTWMTVGLTPTGRGTVG
jgi:hypothetical protein